MCPIIHCAINLYISRCTAGRWSLLVSLHRNTLHTLHETATALFPRDIFRFFSKIAVWKLMYHSTCRANPDLCCFLYMYRALLPSFSHPLSVFLPPFLSLSHTGALTSTNEKMPSRSIQIGECIQVQSPIKKQKSPIKIGGGSCLRSRGGRGWACLVLKTNKTDDWLRITKFFKGAKLAPLKMQSKM